ncbi:unannotated protein [freshwater metagenome]|uniref:Unannotated protein n=1 Tax=freshwater metagenome TaxID=449393 RepID=A0A6J7CVR2_9ZZZZ
MTGERQDVGGMTAAAALDMEGVDRPPVNHRDGVGDGQCLVEAVGVEGDLDVELVGNAQGRVDGAEGGASVLMHLEAARMGHERLPNRVLARR